MSVPHTRPSCSDTLLACGLCFKARKLRPRCSTGDMRNAVRYEASSRRMKAVNVGLALSLFENDRSYYA